ncbi:unnamed protein product [Brassica rapa subsp. trilocularis]
MYRYIVYVKKIVIVNRGAERDDGHHWKPQNHNLYLLMKTFCEFQLTH